MSIWHLVFHVFVKFLWLPQISLKHLWCSWIFHSLKSLRIRNSRRTMRENSRKSTCSNSLITFKLRNRRLSYVIKRSSPSMSDSDTIKSILILKILKPSITHSNSQSIKSWEESKRSSCQISFPTSPRNLSVTRSQNCRPESSRRKKKVIKHFSFLFNAWLVSWLEYQFNVFFVLLFFNLDANNSGMETEGLASDYDQRSDAVSDAEELKNLASEVEYSIFTETEDETKAKPSKTASNAAASSETSKKSTQRAKNDLYASSRYYNVHNILQIAFSEIYLILLNYFYHCV